MAPIEEARKQEVSRTIWNAVLFLLIGLAGIVSLMLAQGYQAARSSLSRIRAFSDSLVENMPIGLIATDAKGLLSACNKAAEGIFGLKEVDVLGKQAVEIIPRECGELFRMPSEKTPAIEKEIT